MKTLKHDRLAEKINGNKNLVNGCPGRLIKIILVIFILSGMSLFNACLFPGPEYGRRGGHNDRHGHNEQQRQDDHHGEDHHGSDDHHDF